MKNLLILLLIVFSINTIIAQKRELWGTTCGDILKTGGSIFKTDSLGENIELMYRFTDEGKIPKRTRFCQVANGKMYAVVSSGGDYGEGAIIEFNINTDVSKVVFSFNGTSDGTFANGGLLLANNSKLYGMCYSGGQYLDGNIYEFDPATKHFQVIFNFKSNSTGHSPRGGLIQAANGKLYGLTSESSNGIGGTIFEYDLGSNTFTTLVDFASIYFNSNYSYGRQPGGDLLQISNGHLFGMTAFGGSNNGGVIFDYNITADTLIIRHNFSGTYSTKTPWGTLMQASNGKLYGFTLGSLFEFNPVNNQYSTKALLTSTNGPGAVPVDRLTEVAAGRLYGMCYQGGVNSEGILFEYNTQTGVLVKKLDFNSTLTGKNPKGSLFLANNGLLYGMTTRGGTYDLGVIFSYNRFASQAFKKLFEFKPNLNGKNPTGAMLLASNGRFYGMTVYGGVYNKGVLYEYDPATFTYTKKYDFNGVVGEHPYGSLMQASNGKLYGLTYGENSVYSNNLGTLFEYDIQSDSIHKLKSFLGYLYGGRPYGELVQDSAGFLYGITSDYGIGKGCVFKYDIVNNNLVSYNLSSQTGNYTRSSFIVYNDSILLAPMRMGGDSSKGTIMSFNTITHTVNAAASFDRVNGAYPIGSLLKTSNGRIFGLASSGGASNHGVLYEYANGVITKKSDFNGSGNGRYPISTLMQAHNGKLYGMATSGGSFDKGTLFEYDIAQNKITVKHSFNIEYGSFPRYSKLIERDACANVTYSSFTTLACNSYTSPSGKIWTQTGIYVDTVSNRFYCDSIVTIYLYVSHVDTSVSIIGSTLSANYSGGVYQWLDCDNAYAPISGATGQSYTPSVSGNYAVMIVGNGCIDTSACYAINTVGIVENTFETTINVFPNPTDGKLSVLLGTDYDEIELSVRNAMGKLVFQKHYFDTNRIDLNLNVVKGIYLLELRDTHGRRSLIKIVKE